MVFSLEILYDILEKNHLMHRLNGPIILIFFCSLSLTSCGYRFGTGECLGQYRSVCIPYVEGDREGLLTTALIHAVTTSGTLAYRSYGSDLSLRVCLLDPLDTNIGFGYAPPQDEGGKSKIVVSNEARLTLTACVSLIDRCTGECVFGPSEVTTSLTYDFEPDLGNVDEHAFSLGQLEMHNLAHDAALPPLYTRLAQKIVDYVGHCW